MHRFLSLSIFVGGFLRLLEFSFMVLYTEDNFLLDYKLMSRLLHIVREHVNVQSERHHSVQALQRSDLVTVLIPPGSLSLCQLHVSISSIVCQVNRGATTHRNHNGSRFERHNKNLNTP